ncbi:hypothetical protein F9278_30830 [Streptomyces phaeolivaceus]|uniref:RHS repeat-associated core domain-containing protein n=1 Tax=Streptomyces phaeolivaceus TaxID=2653200 RepID=A0A5P8K9Z3_9ACTN|nr:hypothetical protein [Streptomyces phaeolivaceus]QFQ99826.1 hypothetical protein F9278_30830 [Streptomyces phaeolivaceus]
MTPSSDQQILVVDAGLLAAVGVGCHRAEAAAQADGLRVGGVGDLDGHALGLPVGERVAGPAEFLLDDGAGVPVDAGVSTSAYDGNGKVATTTDPTGTLTYDYDALQRPTAIKQGTTALSLWTYDSATGGKGQLASATSYANGKAYRQTAVAYDSRSRVTQRRLTVPDDGTGLAGTYTIGYGYGYGYGYDLADHLTSVTYPAIGGLPAETVTTAYSAQGMPEKVSSPLATYQSSIGFDRLGRVNARTYGASGTDATVSRAYAYHDADGTGLLSGIKTTVTAGGTTTTAQDDSFVRNLGGHITGATDGVTEQSECFTYDELNRIGRRGEWPRPPCSWSPRPRSRCCAPLEGLFSGGDAASHVVMSRQALGIASATSWALVGAPSAA